MMNKFESVAFELSTCPLLAPNQELNSIEIDLIGTPAAVTPIKWLNSRKTDREGHTPDVAADYISWFVLYVQHS